MTAKVNVSIRSSGDLRLRLALSAGVLMAQLRDGADGPVLLTIYPQNQRERSALLMFSRELNRDRIASPDESGMSTQDIVDALAIKTWP